VLWASLACQCTPCAASTCKLALRRYRVLHVALPRLLAMFLAHMALPHLPQGHECLAALHGATLELLCRSLAALGQQEPAPGSNTASAAGPEHAAAQLDQQQQQEAFDALLVHISAYCHTLTAPAAGLTTAAVDATLEWPAGADAAADSQVAGAHSKQKDAGSRSAASAGGGGAEGGALPQPQLAVLLAQRAFGELAAAVKAAAADGLACGRAQTLLLHLLKVRAVAPGCDCDPTPLCVLILPCWAAVRLLVTTREVSMCSPCVGRSAVSSRSGASAAAPQAVTAGRRQSPRAGAQRRASATKRCWSGCGAASATPALERTRCALASRSLQGPT
jgi:hypothetical protein